MTDTITKQEPKLVERRCGGWLATSADDEPIKIGVAAFTREGAKFQYWLALQRWKALLNSRPAGGDA